MIPSVNMGGNGDVQLTRGATHNSLLSQHTEVLLLSFTERANLLSIELVSSV